MFPPCMDLLDKSSHGGAYCAHYLNSTGGFDPWERTHQNTGTNQSQEVIHPRAKIRWYLLGASGFLPSGSRRFQLAKTRHVRDAVQTPAKRREHHEG